MKKIKILFLIGGFETGGKERQLTELIKGLDPNEFDIFLLIRSKGAHYLDDLIARDINIINLGQKNFNIRSFFSIRKYIKEIKPDYVHSWALITSVLSVFIRFSILKPFRLIDGSIRQANPKNSQSRKDRILRFIVKQFSEYIIANSFAGHRAYNTPKSKAFVIHNGFDFKRNSNLFPKDKILEEWGLKGYFIVGMVARFYPQKDWNTFVSTAINIINKTEDVAFICVGDGPNLNPLKSKIPNSIINRIVFCGKRSDTESIVNTFDLAVLLSNSKIHGEGISNSITEYMSLEKAVIANANGGNSELIQNDDLGILIQESDEIFLEQMILNLKKDEEKRRRIAQNAKIHIQHNFSIDQMVRNYTNFYKNHI